MTTDRTLEIQAVRFIIITDVAIIAVYMQESF